MPPTKYPWGYPNLTRLAIPWFDPVTEPGKALASYCSEFSKGRLHSHTKRKGFESKIWRCLERGDHLARWIKASYKYCLFRNLGLGREI